MTRFVDYYSSFLGPEAISIVVEPQGVLTCWSSTLAVLADSGPFHGLLLTVLGSQSDYRFMDYYSRFRALLLSVLGTQSDFHD